MKEKKWWPIVVVASFVSFFFGLIVWNYASQPETADYNSLKWLSAVLGASTVWFIIIAADIFNRKDAAERLVNRILKDFHNIDLGRSEALGEKLRLEVFRKENEDDPSQALLLWLAAILDDRSLKAERLDTIATEVNRAAGGFVVHGYDPCLPNEVKILVDRSVEDKNQLTRLATEIELQRLRVAGLLPNLKKDDLVVMVNAVVDLLLKKDQELEQLTRRHRNLSEAANNLMVDTAFRVVQPIWRSRGRDFKLAPASARNLRRDLGIRIFELLKLLSDNTFEDILGLFEHNHDLLEDSLARALKARKIEPPDPLYDKLARWIADRRLERADKDEDRPAATNPSDIPEPADD